MAWICSVSIWLCWCDCVWKCCMAVWLQNWVLHTCIINLTVVDRIWLWELRYTWMHLIHSGRIYVKLIQLLLSDIACGKYVHMLRALGIEQLIQSIGHWWTVVKLTLETILINQSNWTYKALKLCLFDYPDTHGILIVCKNVELLQYNWFP
jgi:hypothetical protein